MSNDLNALFEKARDAGLNAYAPYSKYHVGAALVTSSGQVFTGCNVENAAYKGTCAEAGAIAAMHLAGERRIADIVVVGPRNDECTPCGDCRQRVREFADATTKIHTFTNDGHHLGSYTIEELLPKSFGPQNLNF